MTEIDVLIRANEYGAIYKNLGKVKVDSVFDEKELIGFLKAGIEAYEDWKVNGDRPKFSDAMFKGYPCFVCNLR